MHIEDDFALRELSIECLTEEILAGDVLLDTDVKYIPRGLDV